MGLGYAQLKDKSAQMGIYHLMDILNKPTDRGYLAYAHTSRVATTYQNWPKKAYEANKAILPTLRIRVRINKIRGRSILAISNGRIIDASIIKNIDQRCIDYLAPASMMHRLSCPRINDASII
jgi:hypothetical protein